MTTACCDRDWDTTFCANCGRRLRKEPATIADFLAFSATYVRQQSARAGKLRAAGKDREAAGREQAAKRWSEWREAVAALAARESEAARKGPCVMPEPCAQEVA